MRVLTDASGRNVNTQSGLPCDPKVLAMTAVILGATGGISAALANSLADAGHKIIRIGRRTEPWLDVLDEASIAAAAGACGPDFADGDRRHRLSARRRFPTGKKPAADRSHAYGTQLRH